MGIYEYDEEAVYAMWAEEFKAEGMAEGREEGREEAFLRMVADGRLSAEEAAEYLGVSPDRLREKLQAQLTVATL